MLLFRFGNFAPPSPLSSFFFFSLSFVVVVVVVVVVIACLLFCFILFVCFVLSRQRHLFFIYFFKLNFRTAIVPIFFNLLLPTFC